MLYFPVKTIAAVLLLISCSLIAAAQQKLTCKDLHEGTFYLYPKNTDLSFTTVREGNLLHETNLTNGDTALEKVKWEDDCTYSLTLLDMNGANQQQVRSLMKKHKLLFTIHDIGDDYYTFTSYFDKPSALTLVTDTAWFHAKTNLTSNELIRQVSKDSLLAKQPITDTSKYALLYVYRPGKIKLSLASYFVYFDNNLICAMQNSSGYVFKVMKEGSFELKSQLNKDKATLPVDIRFGHAYFIKSSILFGMYHNLNNYKLLNEMVTEEEGNTEFFKSRHY